METLRSVGEILRGVFDSYKLAVALASALLTVGLTAHWWSKSAKLVARTFVGERSGRPLEVLRILVRATGLRLLKQQGALSSPELFGLVRQRIEHELIIPRPVPGSRGHDASFRASMVVWRKLMRRSFDADTIGGPSGADSPDVSLMPNITPGDINGNAALITRYFIILRALGTPEKRLHFLTKVRVEGGFLSPLHLLTGSFSRFEDDWRKILAAFEDEVIGLPRWLEDAAVDSSNRPPVWIQGFREIQRSLFDCWLQWGPSIPNSSRQGDTGVTTLQYGYGDESNSVEVVGPRDYLSKCLDQLWRNQQRPTLAVPCRATGYIAHTKASLQLRDKVGPALRKSWRVESNALEDGRIVLWVDGKEDHALHPGEQASYYSAYLWTLFVVLIKDKAGRTRPLHPLERNNYSTDRPWLDLLPVFEHCNIASAPALTMGKHLLAAKAIATIKYIAELAGGPECPLRFAYACGVDDPGDGKKTWLHALGLVTDVKSIAQELEELSQETSNAWLFAGEDPIVRLGYYASWHGYEHPYTTHELIDHIQSVLTQMEAR